MTEQPTVALAMIVKGVDSEAPLLAQCLASISGYVDDIILNINHKKGVAISKKVLAVASQYNAIVLKTVWEDNFVKARNTIFDEVGPEFDWVMWLDSDDVVDNPEVIRNVIAVVPDKVQGIYIKYDYAHDEYGNVTVTHWVCRLARNNGSYKWESSFNDGDVAVHETLVQVRSVPKLANEEFKVIHKADPDRSRASLVRNITLLEGMYKTHKEEGQIDPRILFYLGTHYYDAQQFTAAKSCLQDYLQLSGWAEERAEAFVYLALIVAGEEKFDVAEQYLANAWLEDNQNPRTYVELGQLEYTKGNYQKSVDFLKMAVSIKEKRYSVVSAPMQSSYRAYMLLAQSYTNLGGKHLKDAKDYVQKALKLRPLDPDAQEAKELIEKLLDTVDTTKAIVRLTRVLEDSGEEDKVMTLLGSIPKDLQDSPAVINIRNHYAMPEEWPYRSIAIYVGPSSAGIWGPWTLNETGVGGSEEAVIRLGKELNELGWKVVVYGTPGDRAGMYDGVEWKQYWEFNPNDTFDVLIGWRSPWFFDTDLTARKHYLWLHDVIEKPEFTKERLDRMDGVIFVSQYHANLYKDLIPEEKWFVSGNGIDPKEFEKLDGKYERNPHRLIYTSANERGLKILYDIWPQVKKAVPDATLDSYYGWESFKAIQGGNPERMAWMNDMIKTAKSLDGVTMHGRLPQDKLDKELFKSGVFAYPCIFPEVYCISYAKAVAAGCYPVATDFACLPQYSLYGGEQVHLDPKDGKKFEKAYARALIKALKANKKGALDDRLNIRRDFSWQRTADFWNEELK